MTTRKELEKAKNKADKRRAELNNRYKNYRARLEEEILDLFGFCHCGDPETIADGLQRSLNIIRIRGECRKPVGDLFSEADVAYLYLADKAGLTDHGGSVFSAWLTPKGEKLLKRLNMTFYQFARWQDKKDGNEDITKADELAITAIMEGVED